MKKNMKQIFKCWILSLLACLFQSCIPVYDSVTEVGFRNCTCDTLYVGMSNYNNFDSINYHISPSCELNDSIVDYDSRIIIKEMDFYRRCAIVIPDSLCFFNESNLFVNSDTCYLFLVKYKDAKIYSWDEIRTKKLYGKCIVTRNADGEFDRNIRYMNQSEP